MTAGDWEPVGWTSTDEILKMLGCPFCGENEHDEQACQAKLDRWQPTGIPVKTVTGTVKLLVQRELWSGMLLRDAGMTLPEPCGDRCIIVCARTLVSLRAVRCDTHDVDYPT